MPDRLLAYGRLYRVKDWVHFLPLPLAGWAADHRHGGVVTAAAGVLAWWFGLGYTSAVNQAFDDRVDRAHAKNPVGREFDRRRALVLAAPALVAMFAVLFFFAPVGLLPASVLAIAATLYSAPPRIKAVPVLGTVWNLAVGVPGFFFAGRPDLGVGPARLLVGVFVVLLLASQLIHEAQDRDDDAAGHVRTIATEGGRAVALGGAAAVVLALPAAAWWLGGGVAHRVWVAGACAVFAGVWAARLATRLKCVDAVELKRLRLAYRYTGAFLGAVVFGASVA